MTIKLCYDATNDAHKQAAYLFKKYNKHYTLTEQGNAEYTVVFRLDKTLDKEAYSIKKEETQITVTAADKLGLTYGVGRILHRGLVKLCDTYIVPEKKMRGIYFATHFYNYYQSAPLEKIRDYIEELTLWGCNSIAAWFDMHHFTAIKDAEAVVLLERIKAIFGYAKALGLTICPGSLSNEYYMGADSALLATNEIEGTGYTVKPAGFYHTELCPGKPEAVDLLLTSHREILEYFKELTPDYVWLWPYDQGGCTCEACRPWGCNGFIDISIEMSEMIKSVCPSSKIILSAWRFDIFTKGEWDGFIERFDEIKDHFDALMIDFDVLNVPEALYQKAKEHNIDITSFPEISMLATPWGGFGATPIPYRFEAVYRPTAARHSGGYAYSEGIFEDINKVIVLGLYMGADSVTDIVKDYFSYYFSECTAADAEAFLRALESTTPRNRFNDKGEKENYPPAGSVDYLPTFRHLNPEQIDRAFALACAMKEKLPEETATSDA